MTKIISLTMDLTKQGITATIILSVEGVNITLPYKCRTCSHVNKGKA